MDVRRTLTKFIAGVLLSVGCLGLAAGTAQAQPGPAPLHPGPFPADDGDWGPPKHWCPGEPLPPTGNHVTDPLHDWDMTRCHTYYYVYPDMGNVSNLIWDGDNPPPKPPPPPAIITKDNCQFILGPFCPR